MAVLAFPVNEAARAAFISPPLARSSMARAVAPSANSSPASSTVVAAGAADNGTNWISRGCAMGVSGSG